MKSTYIVGESYNVASVLTRAVNIPKGAVAVEMRGTTAASDFWQFCPRLRSLITLRGGGTVISDSTTGATDRSTSTTVVVSAMQAGDYAYFGCDVPFRGLYFDVSQANGTNGTLAGDYRKSDDTWAALSVTDGTASAGDPFAIDGIVSWTVPTDWTTYRLTTETTGFTPGPFYWVRLASDNGTDATTTFLYVTPLSVQTASVTGSQMPILIASAAKPTRYPLGRDTGGIEFIGTTNDIIRLEWICEGEDRDLIAQ